MLAPILHFPKHPVRLARFGIPAAAPATVLARSWKTPQARALFGGVAAHAFSPLTRPMSSSVGCALICACHAFGWPVARGGSRAITDALAAVLGEHGGKIETGRRVTSFDEVAGADVVVFDLAPAPSPRSPATGSRRGWRAPTAATATGRARSSSTWRWRAACRGRTSPAGGREPSTSAGTFEEIAIAERDDQPRVDAASGRSCSSASSTSPTRAARRATCIPLWVYAHVPSGYTGDATESVLAQIERFAPGFRERIIATSVRTPADLEAYNANYVGGDIITGANGAGPGPVPAAARARSVQHRDRRRLHLLGRDAAGGRRPRDERLQRRPFGAPAPRLKRPTSVVPPDVRPVLRHVVRDPRLR